MDIFNRAQKEGWTILFQGIDATFDEDSLSDLISPTKPVAWNFKNSVPGKCGTIGFRRPPQATLAESTIRWIALSLCLAARAMTCNFSCLAGSTIEPSINDLQTVLAQAAVRLDLDATCLGPLEEIITAQFPELSAAEVQQIKELKEQKQSRFAAKVCKFTQNLFITLN